VEYAVQIKNLTVTLGKYTAIRDLSVDIAAKRIIGFIGPSGAGKTTLIRTIVGRQRITNGEVLVLGQSAGSKQLRAQVTYMTQQLSVYTDLTVQENLVYFARMAGVDRKELAGTVGNTLKEVDLTKHARSLVNQLSGGQKQRVSLAIALIGSPSLVVLDEPTVGLDPILRDQLWQLLRKLAAAGTTVIISSHVMDEAARCDDLLLIREGELLAHGTPEQIRARTHTDNVEQAFIKLVGGAK
jgi:ABC-2 type transport system ATP-binding protein